MRFIKKNLVLGLFVLVLGVLFLTIISINNITSVGEATSCCEKTTSGAWCQNLPSSECDGSINPSTGQPYRSAPTSCESTSYCKIGTCVDSQEGTCRETSEVICNNNEGVWFDKEPEEITQCQLGCCLIGEQAAFVTQTRCKKLSADFGLETNFRTDIQSEVACIASANPNVKGACVTDDGFQRSCRHSIKSDCLQSSSSDGTGVEFHEGFLCSAETLGTNCGPTEQTTCVEDKDEVHFLDSCGNIANIYDNSQINNKEYWSEIKDRDDSCNPGVSNANSAICGNCNYLLGSTCKEFERGNSQTVRPQVGDFVCADLSCESNGQDYEHGETWCVDSQGADENLPGSEHFRSVCYNGEVTVEPCSAFREEICVEGEIDGFSTAACKINEWRGCVVQDNKEDCEDSSLRDCKWLEGESILKDEDGTTLVVNEDGELVPRGEVIKSITDLFNLEEATCVPRYAPGFDFWDAEGEAEELCGIASEDCVVKFKKSVTTGFGWDCVENCDCWDKKTKGANGEWVDEKNNLCLALGDCGSSTNYIGVDGEHDGEVVEIKSLDEFEDGS